MVYNKQYNTRHSGRYNTGGQFVSAGVLAGRLRGGGGARHHLHDEQQQPQQQQQQPAQSSFPRQTPQAQQAFPQTGQNNAAPSTPQQCSSMGEDNDVTMRPDADADGNEETNRPHWMKIKVPGVKKLSKKEKRRRQNQHLRRIITPKNALMVLNEMVLHEQLTNQFKVEPADGPTQYYKSQKTSFCADLTVDGITYKGYGENKLMARNAAAEQAIRALIIKRMQRAGEADAPEPDEDPLPMIQLASYALHKLFSEWEYEGHKVPQLKPPTPSTSDQDSDVLTSIPPKARTTAAKPPKRLPLNASAMHPCMLLTYMRPQLEYRELAVEGDRPQNMLFTMGVDVESATYIGKASNKKEARKMAAKSACTSLFGVQFDEVATATAPQVPAEPAA